METVQMHFSLSTRWNAGRHKCGEEMLNEIRDLGFTRVELGYDLRRDLVEGVLRQLEAGNISVATVHNFCPVPTIAPQGHPELFTLAHVDRRVQAAAVRYTSETIRFAAEIGAKTVVMHAGNVRMKRMTSKLVALAEGGLSSSKLFQKTKMKLLAKREKKSEAYISKLRDGLKQLQPLLRECGVKLGIEIMPTWEAVPTESEIEKLLQVMDDDMIGYWHDMGHAQIRENLGLSNHYRWLERLSPYLLGMHVHDVAPPARDHIMPPNGEIDFSLFQDFAENDIPLVIEPSPRTPRDEVQKGAEYLRKTWGLE